MCIVHTPPGGGEYAQYIIILHLLQEQDLSNTIDKERRKGNLLRKIREYTEDIHRQVKTKEGISFYCLINTVKGVCYFLKQV